MTEYYAQQLAHLAHQQSILKGQIDTEPVSSSYIPRYQPTVSDAWPAVSKILLTQSEPISSTLPYVTANTNNDEGVQVGAMEEESAAFEGKPGELVEEYGEPINKVERMNTEMFVQPPITICNPLADAPLPVETPLADAPPSSHIPLTPSSAIQIPMVEAPQNQQHAVSQMVPSTPPNQIIPESHDNVPMPPHKPANPLILALPLESPEYVANRSMLSAWKAFGGHSDQEYLLLLARGNRINDDDDAQSLKGEEIRIDHPEQVDLHVHQFPILEAFVGMAKLPVISIRPQESLKWAIKSHLQQQQSGCLVLVSSVMDEQDCADILQDSPIPVAILK